MRPHFESWRQLRRQYSWQRTIWKRLVAGAGVFPIFCSVASANITNGLTACLRLDETNGITAFDSAVNGHNASLVNFPGDNSQWVAGRTNGGLKLARASGQYAVISDGNGQLNYGTNSPLACTIALWVNGVPGSYPNGTALLGRGKAAGSEQLAIDLVGNTYRFFCRNSNGVSTANVTDVRPPYGPNGTWQHLAVVIDAASGATNGIRFYVNGQLSAQSVTNAPGILLKSTEPLSLGTREDGSGDYTSLSFNGTLDEVRFYNRALTPAHVQELYEAGGGAPGSGQPDSAFDTLRLRWRDVVNGGTNLDTTDPDIALCLAGLSSSAQSLWNSMNKAPGRTSLWSDLAAMSSNSGDIWNTYNRLETMALAYATPGNALHANASLLADLRPALDWMNTNYYNASKSEYYNWWFWEIGVPLALNDITVLLYDQLSGAQVTNYMNAVGHFSPAPNGTGANLVWKATVVAVSGALIKDGTKLSSASASLGALFPYVTTGDGFYPDGSFVQHSYFAYNGGYGSSLLSVLAPLLQCLAGSAWPVTDPSLTNVYQWVYNSYEPFIYKGAMMDMVRGREIARQAESDHNIGNQAITGIIRLAQFAPAPHTAAFKGMIKYWLQSDTSQGFFTNTDLSAIPLAKAILADTSVASRGELAGHYHFAAMDRVVHLRPEFAFGLSLSSSRIANYESINSENLRGWYTGDGMNYLYNADLSQFEDNFWPTVNPYRLPGTTVDTQSRAAGSFQGTRPPANWVGGAALENWGTAGMELHAASSTLTARKSWFMFADEIVCLGAGITNSDNRTIETIVENRKLTSDGNNTFTVNGMAMPGSLAWAESMPEVSWAHLSGNVPGADIGYWFPQPISLNGLREARTDSWYSLNHYGSESSTPHTRNYLTLWFNHGLNPAGASYAYALLPGKSALETAAYAATPNIQILQNSPAVQAVRASPLGVTAANFWIDGAPGVAGISGNRRSSVLVQIVGTNLTIAVADPTQTNTAGISLALAQAVSQVLTLDSGVTVIQTNPTLQLTINTANAHGKSFRASFVAPITTFAAWQTSQFSPAQIADPAGGGLTADPDHDGLGNLLEYALMLNPFQPDTNVLRPQVDPQGHFALTYTRRKLAVDLLYTIDVSTNLFDWHAAAAEVTQTVLADTESSQTIRAAETTTLGAHVTRYFRLRINYQP